MKAMEAGLAVLADEGTQESLLDLLQSREELYEMLGYVPANTGRHRAGPAAARQELP
jgi:methylisocitrate lyase